MSSINEKNMNFKIIKPRDWCIISGIIFYFSPGAIIFHVHFVVENIITQFFNGTGGVDSQALNPTNSNIRKKVGLGGWQEKPAPKTRLFYLEDQTSVTQFHIIKYF